MTTGRLRTEVYYYWTHTSGLRNLQATSLADALVEIGWLRFDWSMWRIIRGYSHSEQLVAVQVRGKVFQFDHDLMEQVTT